MISRKETSRLLDLWVLDEGQLSAEDVKSNELYAFFCRCRDHQRPGGKLLGPHDQVILQILLTPGLVSYRYKDGILYLTFDDGTVVDMTVPMVITEEDLRARAIANARSRPGTYILERVLDGSSMMEAVQSSAGLNNLGLCK